MTKIEPPSFGKDIAPTDEMIANGKFGNGSYGNDEQALAIVRSERRRIAIQRKEERRQSYEAKVVESLEDIADFQDALIQLGKKTAEAGLKGDKLDKTDLEIIGKALKASDQVSNRILGLASRLDDKAVKQDALSFLIEGQTVTRQASDDGE